HPDAEHRDEDEVQDRTEGVARDSGDVSALLSFDAETGDADPEGDEQRNDDSLTDRVADTRHGAHESGLGRGDRVVRDLLAVGLLLLHGDGDAVDDRTEVRGRVEEHEVALQRLPGLLLVPAVQPLDDRRHGVGECRGLEPLVVVVGVGEERPDQPGEEQVLPGDPAFAALCRRPAGRGFCRAHFAASASAALRDFSDCGFVALPTRSPRKMTCRKASATPMTASTMMETSLPSTTMTR